MNPAVLIVLGVFALGFTGFLYTIGAFDHVFPESDHVASVGSDKIDLLFYFRENDFIRDVSSATTSAGEVAASPDSAPVVYTFLGILCDGERTDTDKIFTDGGELKVDQEDVTAIVYDGELTGGEEEIGRHSHLVKPLTLPQLFAYTNVQAKVRRQKMRGANLYCKLQGDDAEEQRKEQFEKKTAMDRLEASDVGCDMVEQVQAQIENQPRGLPSPDEDKDWRDFTKSRRN